MSLLTRLRLAPRPIPSLRHSFLRPYGSAALLDYDYYCYDDDHDHDDDTNQGLIEESNGWKTPGRGVHWVIMGDPTSSRHVYADRLSKLLDVPHISMGSLVRQELHPASPLYKQIANAVNQGKLVPEDVIFGLLSKRLEEGYRSGETGFILDGIPRTRMQAEILDQMAEIDLVLNLKCAEGSLSKSPSGNGIYAPSREIHSVATSGFSISVQPQSGHFQSPRVDSDASWTEKLRVYAEQSKPVEEYYRQRKKLLDFQVSGGSGDAWQGLLVALQLQHMKASNSSHKLTA